MTATNTKTILFADDDDAIQICMEEIASLEHWNLVCVKDGAECLRAFYEKKPDLLILDLRMPKLTGEEVLMKLDSEKCDVPIILISADKNLDLLARFTAVKKIMTKPFELSLFINTVNDLLKA